jgi:hypothetical protein
MSATVESITLCKVEDLRGNLTFIEGKNHIPFAIRRVYWIYDVPGGQVRGGHAYKNLHEFIVALSGSFDVVLHDGTLRTVHSLNRSYFGVYVPNMVWRSLENFSTNAVALILASDVYNVQEYIRDFDGFQLMVSKRGPTFV